MSLSPWLSCFTIEKMRHQQILSKCIGEAFHNNTTSLLECRPSILTIVQSLEVLSDLVSLESLITFPSEALDFSLVA